MAVERRERAERTEGHISLVVLDRCIMINASVAFLAWTGERKKETE